MQKSHQEQTMTELRTAFEAGRLSVYFDRSAVAIDRVVPARLINKQPNGSEQPLGPARKGEEWHH